MKNIIYLLLVLAAICGVIYYTQHTSSQKPVTITNKSVEVNQPKQNPVQQFIDQQPEVVAERGKQLLSFNFKEGQIKLSSPLQQVLGVAVNHIDKNPENKLEVITYASTDAQAAQDRAEEIFSFLKTNGIKEDNIIITPMSKVAQTGARDRADIYIVK